MKFLPYNPEQAYLLPPRVADVLGKEHLCFFLRRVVDRLDLNSFEEAYEDEGRPAYAPELLVAVWLYAYALGVTSSRRLEQRVREDLAFRYLAAGATPDFWTLNQFRRQHGRALNDLFTQVVELARAAGLGRLGHVAIDSTRVAANASPNRVETKERLRAERARIRRRIRRWQQACNADDPNEASGLELKKEEMTRLQERLAEIPSRLEQEESPAATHFPDRPRQPFSARPPRLHFGIHGGCRRQRGSSDRRAACDTGGHRQCFAASRGGGGRAALRGNATESKRRQRLLFGEELGGPDRLRHRRLCAGLQHGPRFESGWTRAASYPTS